MESEIRNHGISQSGINQSRLASGGKIVRAEFCLCRCRENWALSLGRRIYRKLKISARKSNGNQSSRLNRAEVITASPADLKGGSFGSRSGRFQEQERRARTAGGEGGGGSMSTKRTDPKKPARKKSEALAVKAPAPTPAPVPTLSAQFSLDKNGKLQVPDTCYAKIIDTFMGPLEARRRLKLGFDHRTTLLGQVSGAIPYGKGQGTTPGALNFALDAVASLEPRDGLEVMLCSQLVALHSQGMEYMRRAMLPEQTNDGVDHNVNRATKMLRTFATLTESLRAHRGGGKQTMTVEHVTVQAGGQAIVGTVNRGVGGGDEKQNGE